MSRPLRIEYPGAHYHAFGRGNARQTVFYEPADFESFFDLLGETCLRFDWHCHAHCLMPNHYHLLIETRAATLSAGMRHLCGVFTQRYNRRHKRVGHVYQGRFKALLVQDQRYMLELARYIVLNPVRARLVGRPEEWPWSSHAWLVGTRTAPCWAAPDTIWRWFASTPTAAANAFSRYLGEPHEAPTVGWSVDGVLGDPAFKREQGERVATRRDVPEIPVAMRMVDRPPLSELLDCGWSRGTATIDERIHTAIARWHYSQGEVARYLRVHRTTVGKAIARCQKRQSAT